MNRFWLKIGRVVVLAAAAVIIVYVLWPAETEPTGKLDTGADKEKQAAVAEQDFGQAEKLYRTALLYEGKGALPYLRYKKTADSCREILQRYPDSPQAEKAKHISMGV